MTWLPGTVLGVCACCGKVFAVKEKVCPDCGEKYERDPEKRISTRRPEVIEAIAPRQVFSA